MTRQKFIARQGILFALTLALAGCNGFKAPTPKNFTRELNIYFNNHDDCLFSSPIRLPYEASTAAGEADPKKKGLDALAAAGLLKSLEDRDIHVKRYEATTYGSHIPPRFCYGHRVVTSIISFTPPTVVNGQQTTQVDYQYKMMDVPSWADSEQVKAAFPALAKSTSGAPEDHATLVLTMNGWRVPE